MDASDQRVSDERGASDLLDSIGLDKVLQDLGVSDAGASGAMRRLGVSGTDARAGASQTDGSQAASSSRLRLDEIYREDFESDEDLAPLEDEAERTSTRTDDAALTERYFQSGLAAMPLASTEGA